MHKRAWSSSNDPYIRRSRGLGGTDDSIESDLQMCSPQQSQHLGGFIQGHVGFGTPLALTTLWQPDQTQHQGHSISQFFKFFSLVVVWSTPMEHAQRSGQPCCGQKTGNFSEALPAIHKLPPIFNLQNFDSFSSHSRSRCANNAICNKIKAPLYIQPKARLP